MHQHTTPGKQNLSPDGACVDTHSNLTSLVCVAEFSTVFKLRLSTVTGGGGACSLATLTEFKPSTVHSNLHQLTFCELSPGNITERTTGEELVAIKKFHPVCDVQQGYVSGLSSTLI